MKKLIDIERLLKEKNPSLEKWLPGFMIDYLKTILHQDEVNRFLHENRSKKNFAFCRSLVKKFNLKFKTVGLENIQKARGPILASNHPLGAFDALGLVHEVSKIRPDLKFITNDVLNGFQNVEDYMVGVNKHGSTSKSAVQEVNELFASDKPVCIFPAGLVSRKPDEEVVDTTWKKTFICRAKKFKRDVIPVHISGELSSFFYHLSNIRRMLGVKLNLEMMYLVDETFKLKNKTFKITIGKPISYKAFNNSKTDLEWAAEVRRIVYNLKYQAS